MSLSLWSTHIHHKGINLLSVLRHIPHHKKHLHKNVYIYIYMACRLKNIFAYIGILLYSSVSVPSSQGNSGLWIAWKNYQVLSLWTKYASLTEWNSKSQIKKCNACNTLYWKRKKNKKANRDGKNRVIFYLSCSGGFLLLASEKMPFQRNCLGHT